MDNFNHTVVLLGVNYNKIYVAYFTIYPSKNFPSNLITCYLEVKMILIYMNEAVLWHLY